MALILWVVVLLPRMWLDSSLPASESNSKLEHTSFFPPVTNDLHFKISLTHGCVFQMAVSGFFSSSIFTSHDPFHGS